MSSLLLLTVGKALERLQETFQVTLLAGKQRKDPLVALFVEVQVEGSGAHTLLLQVPGPQSPWNNLRATQFDPNTIPWRSLESCFVSQADQPCRVRRMRRVKNQQCPTRDLEELLRTENPPLDQRSDVSSLQFPFFEAMAGSYPAQEDVCLERALVSGTFALSSLRRASSSLQGASHNPFQQSMQQSMQATVFRACVSQPAEEVDSSTMPAIVAALLWRIVPALRESVITWSEVPALGTGLIFESGQGVYPSRLLYCEFPDLDVFLTDCHSLATNVDVPEELFDSSLLRESEPPPPPKRRLRRVLLDEDDE